MIERLREIIQDRNRKIHRLHKHIEYLHRILEAQGIPVHTEEEGGGTMLEEYIHIFTALGMTLEFTDTLIRIRGEDSLERHLEVDNPIGRVDQDILMRGILVDVVRELIKPKKIRSHRFSMAQAAAFRRYPALDNQETRVLVASLRRHLEGQGVLDSLFPDEEIV